MVNKTIPLTVYKASAGSGKTFTLAIEYIQLVIKNPACYRNILAVTFTNKATEEMKTRILTQLYGLWKQLPSSQTYMVQVTEALGFAPAMVAAQAGEALKLLLHNYNYFRVETIDTFFQSVLRNMARELDLTANLCIGLNDYQVEEQAVDELIENLNVQDKVFGWIMQYVKENISEDKGWNVIGLIKRFGKNIFSDIYRENSKAINQTLSQQGFFSQYTKTLQSIRTNALNKLNHYVAFFFDTLEENGLEISDFSRGRTGVCGYFIKLRDGKYSDKDVLTKTVLDAMEDAGKWVKAADRKAGNVAYELVNDVLMAHLNETERVRRQQVGLYQSAELTLKHLNQLRLLENIEKTVREINEDANRFLLSDTQHLLNAIIQDSDSPFVFEKIGAHLNHIMIDEFQDTSTIQWKNFRVLLQECMSHDDDTNLIVGDVKQSIYRWRSGDWRLLNNIEDEFAHATDMVQVKSLITNYRSLRNVIEFNNAFFTLATKTEYGQLEDNEEAQQLVRAYADVRQIPGKLAMEGHIEIELMPKQDYQEQIMTRIADTIDSLLQRGFAANSIAILCRSKSTIQEIADYFCENRTDLPLISDEAFRLDTSEAVNTIISSLRFIANPADKIEQAFLEKVGIADIIERDRDNLLGMPLYNQVQHIYGILGKSHVQHQSAYLLDFFDRLSAFLADSMPDINDFLDEWDNNLHEKTIQSNEANGIRLITIHKSKGLEFDHVILPACDWALEKTGTTLWCTPTVEPFNQMPLVPIDFSKNAMMGTIYEADYHHEHLQNVVDNLNLLYVAFTRAKKSLYIYGKRGTPLMRSKLIEDIMEPLGYQLGGTYTGDAADRNSTLCLDYGELLTGHGAEQETNRENENVFRHPAEAIGIQELSISAPKATFRQSNKSQEFLEDTEDDDKARYIKTGSLLHKVFSMINTADDIEGALAELESEGLIYDSELKRDKLIAMLRSRLENEKVRDWFSDRWTVYNEQTILHIDPVTNSVVQLRPDRVITDGNQYIVIDFKFGRSRPEYQAQVRGYIDQLRQMGHTQVSGYLWFVYSNQIEEVR